MKIKKNQIQIDRHRGPTMYPCPSLIILAPTNMRLAQGRSMTTSNIADECPLSLVFLKLDYSVSQLLKVRKKGEVASSDIARDFGIGFASYPFGF